MEALPTETVQLIEEASLRYVSDLSPGIRRIKTRKHFVYATTKGEQVSDQKTLARIEALGIPPGWTQVWICPTSNGHIQATGRDEKGRKQYIYHARWIEAASQHKFDKLLTFSKTLPTLRTQVAADMRQVKLTATRIIATVVWILENTYIRIGNTEYARAHKHFGLTTMRNRHVTVSGNTVVFDFIGKSGRHHTVDVTHPRVARTIEQLEELPGYELFQYLDEDGNQHVVCSEDVNSYLQSLTGEVTSAKDFRTWGGTVLAAVTLKTMGPWQKKKDLTRNLSQAVKEVAKHLGNTPLVCRSYYIHPVIPVSYEKHELVDHFTQAERSWHKRTKHLTLDEYAVAKLLEKHA